jgi:membrane associated rhomboid family serine protease
VTTNARGRLELDPSVCYRHPGRQSWTLCERCGRTICPECQVLTPRGVQCPECVRESGGSLQWQPAGPQKPGRPHSARQPAGAPRVARPVRNLRSARSSRRISGLLAALPSGAPVTWTLLAVVVALWIVSLVTSNLPVELLAGFPQAALQLWRFVTASLVYPADFGGAVSLLHAVVFFGLSGPQLERQLGRNRFLAILGVAAVVSTAAEILAGQVAYGLVGPLFGLFGALLVLVWSDQRIRTQILVMIGFNLLLSLVLSGAGLPGLVGGLLAGAGTTYALRSAEDHPGRRPWLIVGGSTALLVVLAVLRGVTA